MKRMVKSVLGFSGIVAVALLFASCYAMSIHQTGSINLTIGTASSRGLVGATSDKARIYLYTYAVKTGQPSLYSFPSNENRTYKEASYPGTVTLSNIPVGLWKVLVSIGTEGPEGTDAFSTNSYGQSKVFNLTSAGASVTVATQPSPFVDSPDLLGNDLNSVVCDYNGRVTEVPSILVSSATTLWDLADSSSTYIPDLSSATPVNQNLSTTLQIKSLSVGFSYFSANGSTPCIFISCNRGIVPYSYNGLGTDFSIALTDPSGNRYSVAEAGAVVDASGLGLAIYYRRDHGIGGVFLNASNSVPFDGKSGARWVDIDFSGEIIGDPVYALAFNQEGGLTYGYFATKLGAFRADPSLVTFGQSGAGDLSKAIYFTAPNNEPIQALAVDGQDDVLYIGTPQGAYYATLDTGSSGVIVGDWTAIAETMGDNIVSIVVDKSTGEMGYPEAVALRSTYNLYTISGPPLKGGVVETYPFNAGLPGELHSMDFAFGTLFVAGSWGLTSLYVSPPMSLPQ